MYYDIIPNIFSNLCWLDVRFIMFYQSVHQSVYPCRIPVIADKPSRQSRVAPVRGSTSNPWRAASPMKTSMNTLPPGLFRVGRQKIGGISWKKNHGKISLEAKIQ